MISRFSLLNQSELLKIHNAALEILETVGIKIDSKDAVKILQSAGAEVGENNIVKIFPSIIQKAIDRCRPQYSLFHRNTDREMVLGDGIIKHSVMGWMSEILDWKMGGISKCHAQGFGGVS